MQKKIPSKSCLYSIGKKNSTLTKVYDEAKEVLESRTKLIHTIMLRASVPVIVLQFILWSFVQYIRSDFSNDSFRLIYPYAWVWIFFFRSFNFFLSNLKNSLQCSVQLEITHWVHCSYTISTNRNNQLFRSMCHCTVPLHRSVFGNDNFCIRHWSKFEYHEQIPDNERIQCEGRNWTKEVSFWNYRVSLGCQRVNYNGKLLNQYLYASISMLFYHLDNRSAMRFVKTFRRAIACYFLYATISISSLLLVSVVFFWK